MDNFNLLECLINLCDIIVFSKIFEDVERQEDRFERLKQLGLKLKGSKCDFLQWEHKNELIWN